MIHRFSALAALTAACVLSSAQPVLAQTQLFNSHAFLQAPNVEVGVRPNGALGSTVVPAGYNANAGSCLGFIVSRNNDGFPGTQIDGDFFCPGSPLEAWSLEVGAATAINDDGTTDIPGSLGSLVAGPPTHSVTWSSTAPWNGIGVAQTYAIADAGQTLNISVTLTNTTGADIGDVRYARIVDPDNQTQPGDPYTSTNTVVSQGANATVTASFSNGSLIALTSPEPSAMAAFGGGAQRASAIFAGSGWNTTVGASGTTDTRIGLAINVGTIAAGASRTFTLSYPLTAAAVAPPPVATVPTMTEWAMILLGLMLAGAAAVTLQKRARTA